MEYSVLITIISLSVIFIATTLGSSFVFFFRKQLTPKIKCIILGFAGGIMISAAIFGLINPSVEEATSNSIYNGWSFVPPIVGFAVGGLMLYGLDKLVPHFHKVQNMEEGLKNETISKNLKFFLAVTLHNIPEGLSVGFACGLAIALKGDASIVAATSALSLAIGIAIQNVPEGAAVSIPMYGDGMSRGKSFLFGSASGIVEPLFGLLAVFLAQFSIITAWLLAFAAGAMFYVTLDEVLPDSRETGFTHLTMWSFMIGFLIMMGLEIVL